MANVKTVTVEEESAFSQKRKLDLPNPSEETIEEKKDIEEEDESANKKQKLEHTVNNEDGITSFTVNNELAESNDSKSIGVAAEEEGKVDFKVGKDNNEDEHMKVEGVVISDRKATWAEKGKAIVVDESEEDESEEVESSEEYSSSDYDSSDDSDSSCGGLDNDTTDDPDV